jgi:hypothetical protein
MQTTHIRTHKQQQQQADTAYDRHTTHCSGRNTGAIAHFGSSSRMDMVSRDPSPDPVPPPMLCSSTTLLRRSLRSSCNGFQAGATSAHIHDTHTHARTGHHPQADGRGASKTRVTRPRISRPPARPPPPQAPTHTAHLPSNDGHGPVRQRHLGLVVLPAHVEAPRPVVPATALLVHAARGVQASHVGPPCAVQQRLNYLWGAQARTAGGGGNRCTGTQCVRPQQLRDISKVGQAGRASHPPSPLPPPPPQKSPHLGLAVHQHAQGFTP